MKVRLGWISILTLALALAAGTGDIAEASGSNCGAKIFGSIIDRQIAFYEFERKVHLGACPASRQEVGTHPQW